MILVPLCSVVSFFRHFDLFLGFRFFLSFAALKHSIRSKCDRLDSCRLSPRDCLICEVTRRNKRRKCFLGFLSCSFSFLFSFCLFFCASREITYRETVESVRNGSFIGWVGLLESARVGEDFDERAFPSDREACRSHASFVHIEREREGERVFRQATVEGNGSVANQPSTIVGISTSFSSLETLILKKRLPSILSWKCTLRLLFTPTFFFSFSLIFIYFALSKMHPTACTSSNWSFWYSNREIARI